LLVDFPKPNFRWGQYESRLEVCYDTLHQLLVER
jgi:hypothetical protein